MITHASPAGPTSGTRQRLSRATAQRVSQLPPLAILPAPTHEQIALRAYEIYVKRDASRGDEVQDWLAAERELLLLRGMMATSPPTRALDDEAPGVAGT
jgi:hypothetical protein